MSKVTSKLQVTIPKAIADRYGIAPGAEIEWHPAGDAIRVVLSGTAAPAPDLATRRAIFAASVARQRRRQAGRKIRTSARRGWTRADLYTRGRAR
jgi:AbrB family looped-hinge helix DNA binding protein